MHKARGHPRMDPKLLLSLGIPSFCIVICPNQTQQGPQIDIVVNGSSAGSVFDGLGAVSAGASSRLLIDYPDPQHVRYPELPATYGRRQAR